MKGSRIRRARFAELGDEIEMDAAAADCAAYLRIGLALVTVLAVWQRLVLRLFGSRMRDAVCERAMLGEQQGDNEQRSQENGAQHARHSNCRSFAFQVHGVIRLHGYLGRLVY